MNITFFIGNGFDRSAGLDTSYDGFYKWYINQPSSSHSVRQFKEEISRYVTAQKTDNMIRTLWADFESGLGQYTDQFTIETAPDFLEAYEDAHESLCSYLEEEQAKFNIQGVDSSTISQLRDTFRNFYGDLKPLERDVFLQMFQEDLRNNTVIKSVSFNYTGTLDSIIREIAKEPLNSWSEGGTKTMTMDSDVLHIHGTTSLSPIIGVFDESQIKNKALLSYPGIAQVLIKSTSVQTAGERWYNETAAQINRSRIICIWGMSIGKTDAIWWKHITQWLIQDASRHLIVFWHLSSPPTNRSIIVPFQTKKDVISRLTAFSSLSDADIAAISSRIHIVINTETVLKVAFPKK